MSFLGLILVIAVIGFLAWVIVKLIPMPPNFSSVIYIVALIIAILYILHALGIGLPNPSVPKLR